MATVRIVIAFSQAGLLLLCLTMGGKEAIAALLVCAKSLLNRLECSHEIQKHATQIDVTVVRNLNGQETWKLQVVSSEENVLKGVLSVTEKALMKPMEGHSRHADAC